MQLMIFTISPNNLQALQYSIRNRLLQWSKVNQLWKRYL